MVLLRCHNGRVHGRIANLPSDRTTLSIFRILVKFYRLLLAITVKEKVIRMLLFLFYCCPLFTTVFFIFISFCDFLSSWRKPERRTINNSLNFSTRLYKRRNRMKLFSYSARDVVSWRIWFESQYSSKNIDIFEMKPNTR